MWTVLGDDKKLASEIGIYSLLFVFTNFVNKYVLSVLDFKYPTVFQGWQTLVGFIVLRILMVSKHIPTMMTDTSRSDWVPWIPGMMLFAGSVYSGSKGLANLPLPVFFALQNLASVIMCGVQMILTQTLTSFFTYCMMMLTVISSIVIIHSDPQFSQQGYIWIGVHIIFTGGLQIYTKLMTGRLKSSSLEKLYCNYIYCIILFAPSSYLLGDALEAASFPYLYFSKFWFGCILSGVFGVLLCIQSINLQEKELGPTDFAKVQGFSKILASAVSYFVFDDFYTANFAMWIFINLVAGLTVEDSRLSPPEGKNTKDSSQHNNPPPSSRHNVLYEDFIKDDDSYINDFTGPDDL
ncbi:transmembrane protein 241-like [Ostrea edulis]|uniref:transmembrane protein 241-like n=1 Tax=Ostrea edulis TaxID=37623 RepID=UPI0024AFF2F7|nr:transmembrane protein 241-like [Ostrea edulis]